MNEFPIPDMDCEAARAEIRSMEGPRLCDDRIEAAHRHVAGCVACQEALSDVPELDGLWEQLREARAPGPLRERLMDRLATERSERAVAAQGSEAETFLPGEGAPLSSEAGPPFRSSWRGPRGSLGRRWAGIVGFLLLPGLGIGAASLMENPRRGAASAYVQDQLRREIEFDRIETSDPDEVVRFVMRELGLALDARGLVPLEIRAVEICLVDGERTAMITYVRGGTRISHYLSAGAKGTVAPTREDPMGRDGPAVVTWATGRVAHALVGREAGELLLDLARLTARPGP